MNTVENNELVQYTSEAIFEKEAKKLKKQEKEIKAKVCTKNMSQSACNKAYIVERDRINKESYKTIVGIATNIPVIGVIDSGKILITGSSLTGEETNRLWGVAGIISLGNGQKVKNVINKIAKMKSSAKAGKGANAGKKTTKNRISKETEAAQKLGVDLNNIQINNGTAKANIKITSEINYSDVKLLVEHAKSKGAKKVEVNTGYIANEKLMGFLEKRVADGKPFMGGKVIRGKSNTTDFTIIYD